MRVSSGAYIYKHKCYPKATQPPLPFDAKNMGGISATNNVGEAMYESSGWRAMLPLLLFLQGLQRCKVMHEKG